MFKFLHKLFDSEMSLHDKVLCGEVKVKDLTNKELIELNRFSCDFSHHTTPAFEVYHLVLGELDRRRKK